MYHLMKSVALPLQALLIGGCGIGEVDLALGYMPSLCMKQRG